jgi:hypothetical protein
MKQGQETRDGGETDDFGAEIVDAGDDAAGQA